MIFLTMLRPVLYLLVVCSSSIFSQIINDIKDQADKNQSNRSSGGSGYVPKKPSRNNLRTEPPNSSGCLNLYPLIDVLVFAIVKEQNRLIATKEENRDISHLDLILDGQISSFANQILFRPRLRGNSGIFGTELRFYNLNDRDYSDNYQSYNFFDWQVLMLHFFNRKSFVLRIGTGLSHEYYTKLNYWEHTFYCHVKPKDWLALSVEGRIVPDNKTKIRIRQELNLGVDFKVYDSRNFNMLLGLKATKTIFYENINLFTVGPALSLRLR